jgi:hypothetical protein
MKFVSKKRTKSLFFAKVAKIIRKIKPSKEVTTLQKPTAQDDEKISKIHLTLE